MRTVRQILRSSIKKTTMRAVLTVGTMCASARATSVAPMDVQTLADHAAQVIIGRVESAESYWSDDHHRIETALTLTDVRYLKGQIPDSGDSVSGDETFRLIIPGGRVGSRHMSVCCAPAPRVGQRWMFFLLETYHTFPVVGVYQGAFRIVTDSDGIERVYRESHRQLRGVAGINDEGFLIIKQPPASDAHQKLVGADRMRLADGTAANSSAPAMKLADFEAMLEPMLAQSKKYELTQPAGRYVHATHTATTLRSRLPSPSPSRSVRVVRETNITTTGAVDRETAEDDQP